MVRLAKSHKEVLQFLQESTMSGEIFLKDDRWQKFDLYAQEYNEKAKVKKFHI
jgi:hypothetical protein